VKRVVQVPEVPPAPTASSKQARVRMQANGPRDTKPELALRREIHSRGFRYRVDQAPLQSLRCRADLVFGRERLAVFVDGCFWHGCPKHMSWPKANGDWWRRKISATIARDRRNDLVLREAGWTVVRVWEHEAVRPAADRIAATLMELRQRAEAFRALA
jgi:DNA mismatch endonuclease (patch repair protein)